MNYIEINKENTKKLISELNPEVYGQIRVNRYYPLTDMLLKYIDKSCSLLDVGIRDGEFLQVLTEKGFSNLYGIDIYPEGINIAKERGFNCEVADVMNLNLNKTFDVITMSHVLEHTPDVKKVIQNIYSHLNINGILYVETPKEKKTKTPTEHAHYYCFEHLGELMSFFSETMWSYLELIEKGKRLKILLRKF